MRWCQAVFHFPGKTDQSHMKSKTTVVLNFIYFRYYVSNCSVENHMLAYQMNTLLIPCENMQNISGYKDQEGSLANKMN